jgi:ribosomal protein S18 acetylase RimI-like enzyme
MIIPLEELAINAWPALQTLLVDGWVLRLADGYTRRANSINPLYPTHQPILDKMRACEDLYRSRGQNVIYKMTPAVYPADLDATLEAEGYRLDAETSVQTVELTNNEFSVQHDVILSEELADAWLAAVCRMSSIDVLRAVTLRQILSLIVPRHCYASIQQQGEIIACGLAVVQEGFVGFYEIVTDLRFRRQGYGESIMQALMHWGQQVGAQTAYLQVMKNNPPALRLYAKLGFSELYPYWYRVKA